MKTKYGGWVGLNILQYLIEFSAKYINCVLMRFYTIS